MTAITKEIQQSMSPDQAMDRLMEGNERFLNARKAGVDHLGQVEQTRGGQFPFAAVLGCIDSRVPAETIFDQGIGDIFNARVAGNIINEDILGSLEYACKVAGSKLILVMGHTSCGAVASACKRVELGNITALLSKITPVVDTFEDPESQVDQVALKNVTNSMDKMRSDSPILKEMEEAGDIRIQGAMYDVSNGKVTLL